MEIKDFDLSPSENRLLSIILFQELALLLHQRNLVPMSVTATAIYNAGQELLKTSGDENVAHVLHNLSLSLSSITAPPSG